MGMHRAAAQGPAGLLPAGGRAGRPAGVAFTALGVDQSIDYVVPLRNLGVSAAAALPFR